MIGYIVTLLIVAMGTVGAVFRPVVGVASYYWLSIVRPEILWFWAFGGGGNSFSKLVAIGTIIGWFLTGSAQRVVALNRSTIPVLGFALFLLSGAVATEFWAVDPEYARQNLLIQVKIGLLACIAITACNSLSDIKTVLAFIFFGLAFFAWELNLAWVKFYRIPANLLSLHGDNNNISLLLVVALPIGCMTAMLYRSYAIKAVSIVAVFAALHAILFLESRGAYVATACVVGTYFVSAMKVPTMRRPAILAAIGCLCFVLVFAGDPVVKEWNTIFASEEERDYSAQSRLDLAKAGFDILLNNPLGLGPRQEQRVIHEYGFERGKLLHNLYLQVGVDYGVLGLTGYLAYFFGALASAVGYAKRPVIDEEDEQLRTIALGLAVGLVGFLAAGVFLSCERIEIGVIIASLALALGRFRDGLDHEPIEDPEVI